MSNINDLINDICRKFRAERDKFLNLNEHELRAQLDQFWEDQPWWLRLVRKPVMRSVHRHLKKYF